MHYVVFECTPNARQMHPNCIKILGSFASGMTKMWHAHFCRQLPISEPTQGNARQMRGECKAKCKNSQPNQKFNIFFRVVSCSCHRYVHVWQGLYALFRAVKFLCHFFRVQLNEGCILFAYRRQLMVLRNTSCTITCSTVVPTPTSHSWGPNLRLLHSETIWETNFLVVCGPVQMEEWEWKWNLHIKIISSSSPPVRLLVFWLAR